MAARRNATATTAGILRPDELARHVALARRAPSADLEPWVENHWRLTWDLPATTRVPSQVLAHPTVNLTVERGDPRADVGADRVLLTGVATGRFDVELTGSGWVWGVRFRPGGLTALTSAPAAGLTDRTLAAAGLLDADLVSGLDRLPAGTPDADAAALVEAALRPLVPHTPDPAYRELLGIVATMLADRDLVRVDRVAAAHDISPRRLQRLFKRYLGVGPKWVLSRYRLHDVVAALDAGHQGSLAVLAADHGWYDQAHFAREFTVVVGVPPGVYRAGGGRGDDDASAY